MQKKRNRLHSPLNFEELKKFHEKISSKFKNIFKRMLHINYSFKISGTILHKKKYTSFKILVTMQKACEVLRQIICIRMIQSP